MDALCSGVLQLPLYLRQSVVQAAGLCGEYSQKVFWWVAVKPYKQNTWFGLVAAFIDQSRHFLAWLKVWVKPQELCGINSVKAAGVGR